VGDARAT
jgi:hypothetical protein